MEYQIKFLIIVFASSFFGIIIGILNNDLALDKQEIKIDTQKQKENIIPSDDNNQKINETDKNQDKNEIIKNNDFINEDDDEEEKTDKIEKEKEKISEENTDKKEEQVEKEKKEEDRRENEKEKEKENETKIDDITHKDDKNKINYIHIALTIDNKYIYPLLVFLTSLFDSRANSTFYIIHIMTSKNLRPEYFTKINSLIEKQGKNVSNLTYYNMGDDFRGAITGTHISTAAYYRIALPSLLPHVDKIIYTDTDVLNFCDLSEMYSLEFKDKMYFMGTLDQIGLLNELKLLGIITKKYMNSGILLMNLKGMREDDIEKKIRKFIFSHYLDHHDQTAINGACYDNYEILSFKYATFNFKSFERMVEWNNKQDKLYRYNDLELRQAFYEPRLLHFAGWTKPWDKKYNNINGEYWWYYAKKSGFYDEILKTYGFSKDVIEKKLENIPEDGGLLKRNYRKKV